MPPTAFELSALLTGLLLGSFLNVCISRLPHGQSIVQPRSRCTRCHHTILPYDNIPVLSFLLLRGRCRRCRARIPWRYPLVEIACGLWFVSCAVRGWSAFSPQGNHDVLASVPFSAPILLDALSLALLGLLLIPLAVIDWQTQRLPDTLTLPGILLGILLACAQAVFLAPGQGDVVLNSTHQLRLSSPGSFTARGNVFLTGPEALVFGRIGSIAAAALLLLAVRWLYHRLRHREGMGLGDVKLLAMIAAFLGLGSTLLALFAAVLSAALYALTLLARRRADHATRLPFGSFLAAGALFAALLGPVILPWYTGLFH